MGNKHCQQGYRFEQQYNILALGPANSNLYKLQNRQNGQLYVGRELSSNDEHETYELECIVDQKLKNPSPFVTRLLKAQSNIQDSYCSTSNKFYLLFKSMPWLLADEIRDRTARRHSFSLQEVDSVITRVSKGIKYLYDIYHHHGFISTNTITWPTPQPSAVQLVDEWAVNTDINHSNHRIFRPKDEDDMSEKLLQKSNDLYSLGIVAKQMLGVSSGNNHENFSPAYDRLNSKIQVLLALTPQDRFKIYGMVTTDRETLKTQSIPFKPNVKSIQPNFQASAITQTPITNFTSPSNFSYTYTTNKNIQTQQKNHPINFSIPPFNTTKPYGIITSEIAMNEQKIGESLYSHHKLGLEERKIIPVGVQMNKSNVSFCPPRTNFISHEVSHKEKSTNRNSSMDKISIVAVPQPHVSSRKSDIINKGFTLQAKPLESSIPSLAQRGRSLNIVKKPTVQFNNFSANHQPKYEQRIFNYSNSTNFSNNKNAGHLPNSTTNLNILSNNTPTHSSFEHKASEQNLGKITGYGSSEDSLFTPADFFNKIKQSHPLQNQFTTQAGPHGVKKQELISANPAISAEKEQLLKFAQQKPFLVCLQGSSSQNKAIHHALPNNSVISTPRLNYTFHDGQPGTNMETTNKSKDDQNIPNIGLKLKQNPQAQEVATTLQAHQAHDEYKNEPDYVQQDSYVAKVTPSKNSKSNQPFSTIPEVSERSASARSDEQKQYVIEQYQNGSRYEGYKSNGMRNGKGKFYYQQGSFYDGEWKNNNMHGYGRLYYSNNRLAYEGQWFIDQFHGRGKVFNDEPSPIFGFFDYTNFDNLDEKWKYYEGDLVCDSKEGDGKLVLSNEEYYEGQFRNDKVDGKGKFVTKNGQVIKGIWEQSKLVVKL